MSILNHFFDYKPEVLALDEKAMELCQPYFPSVFRVFGLVVRRCSEIFPKYAVFGSKCLSLG